jgi:hypothetical protein
MAAMLPHFDQAIPLSGVRREGKMASTELTGNNHFLSARPISGIALSRGAAKVGTGRLHRQRDLPCPSRLPSSMASFSKESPNPQNQDEVIGKKGKNLDPDQGRKNCIRFDEMIRYANIRQEKGI